ncbi:hypothetical protein NDU88_003909 [Pleurodeles waltl]|uniref:Uncharacterized protein n=1 Tax=Pleurodeles waltl TaxID=8319 RepID=A0AAV7QAB6_PLEWA|nr:hypothetical protein NDU88_003909 [Pleurodeles waltl]
MRSGPRLTVRNRGPKPAHANNLAKYKVIMAAFVSETGGVVTVYRKLETQPTNEPLMCQIMAAIQDLGGTVDVNLLRVDFRKITKKVTVAESTDCSQRLKDSRSKSRA